VFLKKSDVGAFPARNGHSQNENPSHFQSNFFRGGRKKIIQKVTKKFAARQSRWVLDHRRRGQRGRRLESRDRDRRRRRRGCVSLPDPASPDFPRNRGRTTRSREKAGQPDHFFSNKFLFILLLLRCRALLLAAHQLEVVHLLQLRRDELAPHVGHLHLQLVDLGGVKVVFLNIFAEKICVIDSKCFIFICI
jgi:hypothetical protein